MTKKFPLSYSKVNTFDICPLQFSKVYVTKEVKDEGNVHTQYGGRVHESLAQYGKTKSTLTLTKETEQWRGLVDKLRRQPGEKFWEYQMAVDQDLQQVEWFDRTAWLRAIADVLVIYKDKAKLFDWKTGAKVKEDMLQMQIFAAVVFFCFEEVQEVTTGLVFLKPNKIVPQTFVRDNLEGMWKRLLKKFNKVQDAVDCGVFTARPNHPFPCNWCPAKNQCEYNKDWR